RTTPPRSRRSSGEGDEQRDGAAAGAGRVAEPATHPEGEEPGAASDAVSRETAPADETVSRETTSLVDPGAVYREISPAEIEPNPKQPRTQFDEEALAELTHSVKEFGLLQPIVVREMAPGRYQLIMGERRWRASQQAALDSIPAIVRQTEDQDLLRDALLENIHRGQLNPLEEAAAYQQHPAPASAHRGAAPGRGGRPLGRTRARCTRPGDGGRGPGRPGRENRRRGAVRPRHGRDSDAGQPGHR